MIVTSDRPDVVWLKAAALTRSEVPHSLQELILGMALSLDAGAEALLDGMEPRLLEAAIHVFIGDPQPLWYIGTHHGGKSTWNPVVSLVASRPSHTLFEFAWRDVATHGDDEQLATLVRAVGPSHPDRIFELVLRIRVDWANDWNPKTWSAVFAVAPDAATRQSWIDRLVDCIPAIVDDLVDLRFWLTDKATLNAMLHALQSDFVLVSLVRNFPKPEDLRQSAELVAGLVRALKIALESKPPRLSGTCDDIARKL